VRGNTRCVASFDSLSDPRIAEAARRLLDATGAEGSFGYASRNAATGERELVYALRGPSADALLELLAAQHQTTSWTRRLLASLLQATD